MFGFIARSFIGVHCGCRSCEEWISSIQLILQVMPVDTILILLEIIGIM